MKKIEIKKLRDLYNKFLNEDYRLFNKKILAFNYLNLSILFSRDDREFDINNFKLLKKLFNNQNVKKINPISKPKKISGYYKYLFSLKESNYLPNKKLPIILMIDLLKFLKQIFDIFGIFLIIFFSILINNFNSKNTKNLISNIKKVYSIYYWIKKKSESATYYYPGIKKEITNKVFISSFADVKLNSIGLLSSIRDTKFLTPANFLNILDLKICIIQFIHLFLFDLYLLIFKRKLSFFYFWVGWKKASEIFYSILIYRSIIKLSKNYNQIEFVSWYENHITNRAFSLAVSYSKKNKSSSSILSTFNGALITNNLPYYFLPSKLDNEIGLVGEKYYVQDESSKDEFKKYLKSEKIYIEVKKVPFSMVRTKTSLKDENSSKKFRNITIFTHATYWDLLACILSIFNERNKNCALEQEIVKKEKLISIRLHPSLNKKVALEEIHQIKEIPNDIVYEFINNKKENLITSLKSANSCFFGISTYVNLAIELNKNVIAVETNHIYKPPIKRDLLNSPNIKFAIPW